MQRETAVISDVKVLDDGRILVKAYDNNGSLIGGKMPDGFQDDLEGDDNINKEEFKYKILKSNQESESGVKSKAGYGSIYGSDSNRIMSTQEFGNMIVGPTTFTSHPEDIRIGGVFRLNGLLTSTMPSTIITPVSTLVFDFPLADTLKELGKVSATFAGYIAAMSAASAAFGGQ